MYKSWISGSGHYLHSVALLTRKQYGIIPASQTSAQSNSSSAYSLSGRFRSSLSDLSQSSSGNSALDYTPPTSQSQVEAASSQDSVAPPNHQSRSPGRYRLPSQPAPIDTAPRAVYGHSAISTPTSSDSSSPVRGSKRLADGQFKSITPGSNLSPIGDRNGAHIRNTSLDSSVSRAAEVGQPQVLLFQTRLVS